MTDSQAPNECPACGGDVQESAAGWVCDDCDRLLGALDSRATESGSGGGDGGR
jgi:hypothetical protein